MCVKNKKYRNRTFKRLFFKMGFFKEPFTYKLFYFKSHKLFFDFFHTIFLFVFKNWFCPLLFCTFYFGVCIWSRHRHLFLLFWIYKRTCLSFCLFFARVFASLFDFYICFKTFLFQQTTEQIWKLCYKKRRVQNSFVFLFALSYCCLGPDGFALDFL